MITAMEPRSLTGKRILLTRAKQQLPAVIRAVEARGGTAIAFPCLELEVLSAQIEAVLSSLNSYSDILFTSRNGVLSLNAFCMERNRNLQQLLNGKRIAAVGEHTAAALSQLNITVDLIPEDASQAGLITAYGEYGAPEQLLFFRAEEGSDQLANALQKQDIMVNTVNAYRTICPTHDASETIVMLEDNQIDAVLLGSSKTARHYLQRVGSTELANRPTLVAISQPMAAAAEQLGLNVQVVAKRASFDAMLDALSEHFATNPS